MEQLQNLIKEKEILIGFLNHNRQKINDHQIVKEGYLNYLQFKKINETLDTIVYEKEVNPVAKYTMTLHYAQPNLISIQRNEQDKMYGFEIKDVEEFKELLIFLNII